MTSYRTQRILPIILVIVIVVIAVAALVSLARAVFFPSSSSQPAAVVDTSRDALLNTSAGHRVTMTVRGPIVADEAFNSYSISISPSQRTMTTYQGYTDTVLNQQSLGNNTAAYEEFVYALDKANLADGKELDEERNDVRGVCATGRVYEFEIIDGTDVVKKLWTSTCNGSRGSLDANVNQVGELFLAQIPDASDMLTKLDL